MGKNEKTLILVPSKQSYYFAWARGQKFDIAQAYLINKYYIPKDCKDDAIKKEYFRKGVLGTWTMSYRKYNKVIVFGGAYTRQVERFLLRHFSHNAIYCYFWNPFIEKNIIDEHLKYINPEVSVYSYSMQDVGNNSRLKWVSTVYYDISSYIEKKDLTYDLVFGGMIKGDRQAELEKIIPIIEAKGLKIWLDVAKFKNKTIPEPVHFSLNEELQPYEVYVGKILQAKAILDVDTWHKYSTVSLRFVEALAYRKKYVTTNTHYVDEPFYNPNNIFILGIDDIDKLEDFLNEPYDTNSDKWISYFSFDEWIERII